MCVGRTLVLYRSAEHRVLELLKTRALGQVFRELQVAFRRRLGRAHRRLMAEAIGELRAALVQVEEATSIGATELTSIEDGLEAYHRHIGWLAPLFADVTPHEYRQLSELRQLAREMSLKQARLDERGQALELALFPCLHSPAAWAAGKPFGRAARAEGMLRFSTSLLHKPLCQLERLAPQFADRREARRAERDLLAQFKNLHGWLGLRRAAYPAALADEWLRYGIDAPVPLRIELYVQLLKQLTDVGDDAIEERGWWLLVGALSHFAPPVMIEGAHRRVLLPLPFSPAPSSPPPHAPRRPLRRPSCHLDRRSWPGPL